LVEHLGIDTTRELNYELCANVMMKMGFVVENSPKDLEQYHAIWE